MELVHFQDPRLPSTQTQGNSPPLTESEAWLGLHLGGARVPRESAFSQQGDPTQAAAAPAACGGALCRKAWAEMLNGPLFILFCFPFVFSFP